MATSIREMHSEAAMRAISGADRYDEVWDGVLFVPPVRNNEHQEIQARLMFALYCAVEKSEGTRVRPGGNISDRVEGWTHNYRIPDVALFLPDTQAQDCDTHWCGGPDFAVEIKSEGDRSEEKLPFYAQVGVRELLLVHRDPWSLELFRLHDGTLRSVGRSTVDRPHVLMSQVVPLSFELAAGDHRPDIVVRHIDRQRVWEA
jgi:Uma2 family endonuclease